MKKIFAIITLALAGSAFAQSVTLGYSDINNARGNDQKMYTLSVRAPITQSVTADVVTNMVHTQVSNSIGTRFEGGVTVTAPVGPVTGYVRTAVGRRFTAASDYNYYSIEPGVRAPVGPFTAGLGFRFRDAFDNTANADQTRTVRTSLSYNVTKKDSVTLAYDRVNGDVDQKVIALAYTRAF
jgi:hypothetical protein